MDGPNTSESETPSQQKDYRHIRLVIIVVIILLAGAAFVRQLFVPDIVVGEYGFYRAVAPEHARDFTIKHVGETVCIDCHDDVAELHDKDVHATVACEDCHGPGWEHADDPLEVPPDYVPKGKQYCLICHQRLDARPGAFPQIELQEHYDFVGVADKSTDCIACHSPHEPLYLDRDLRTARLHPLITQCRDCHIGRTDRTMPRPAGHPTVFECNYCHSNVVKDFATRSHSIIECTTCHIFIKESDFAGRIIRDSDPRFCLLCHKDAPFRSDDAPPGIDWPDHLEFVAMEPGDKDKRCIDCHRDRIHAELKGGGR